MSIGQAEYDSAEHRHIGGCHEGDPEAVGFAESKDSNGIEPETPEPIEWLHCGHLADAASESRGTIQSGTYRDENTQNAVCKGG